MRPLQKTLRPVIALLIALTVGGVVIGLTQGSVTAPFAAYGALFAGAFGGGQAWGNTLFRTMPILLTGTAVAVALAAGLFNIGAEGQLAVGGLAAAIVGAYAKALPAPLLLLLALLASMAGGAAWAYLPVLLKIKRGAHEVITAILLNYVAQNTTHYLAAVPLRDPTGQAPQTASVGATLPPLISGTNLHAGLVIALFAVVWCGWALRHTVWGYETRVAGANPDAAEASGIGVARAQMRAMLLSGALAGLAGGVLILGDSPFRRFPADFYGAGYGFDGLAVALLAGGSPYLVVPSALLFGGLSAGADAMAFSANIPRQIVGVIQALLIVAVAVRQVPRLPFLSRKRRFIKEAGK